MAVNNVFVAFYTLVMFTVTWFKNSNRKQTKATTKSLTFTVSYLFFLMKN